MPKMGAKRTGRRRRRRPRKNLTLARKITLSGPTAAPDEMRLKLRYTDIGVLDTGLAGILQQRIFRANSLFDPDESGIGGQPMGFDEWSAFYNRYQVTGCSIDIRYMPRPNQANPANVHLYVAPVDRNSAITGIAQAHELPYSKHKLVSPFTNADKSVHLRSYLSTKKKFGYKDISQEDDLSATVTQNPVEQWFWSVGVASATADQMFGDCTITLTYYVRFFDRKDLLRS